MKYLKNNITILSILVLGFALRIAAILADPFLHPWDERFHALVARNMINNPLIPILRVNPVTENYDPFIWCCNHIWLHKQPLFMWQMALSMKIFGISEWSMRLPSAIMGTILVLLLYRIAILLTKNKTIALLSALMLACSNFHLQLIAGVHGMDHNDVAHGFYVLASIWALCEYTQKPKWHWIALVGIFSGAAILNKWLTGLLVYLIWSIPVFISIVKRNDHKKKMLHFSLSVIICCIVFLPWQVYILIRFPELARAEYEFNRRHISEALEGHAGDIYFYLEYLKDLLGKYLFYLIPIGMWWSFKTEKINKQLNYGFLTAILFVFLFFSVVVKTKVDTYLFFVVPLALIYIAVAFNYAIKKASKWANPGIIIGICMITVAFLSLNLRWITNYLSDQNTERNERIYNAAIYKNLSQLLPEDVKVVMNMNSFEDIDVMFYNNGITAYHWTLTEEDFKNLKARKIPVAVFKAHGKYTLPLYVRKYPYLYIINRKLKNF